jgi:mannose-6-phosphate isomerase class I
LLIRAPYFQVEKMALTEPLYASVDPTSPQVLVAVEGSGVIESQGMEPISIAKGQAVVIPAVLREYTVRPQWELEIMRMLVPTGVAAQPATTLQEFVNAS